MAYRTLSDVYDDVRFRSATNSTSLASSDLLRIANKYYRQIVRALVGLGEDFYAEIAEFDLVGNQREYTLPAESTSSPFGGGAIKVQRLEISYDGVNRYVADQINWQQIELATKTDAEVDRLFTKSNPKYALKSRSIFLFPMPDTTDSVASGNKNGWLFYIKRPAEMTATTDIPDLPVDFLDILATGMLIDVYEKFGRRAEMKDALILFSARLDQMTQQETALGEDQQPILRSGLPSNYGK